MIKQCTVHFALCMQFVFWKMKSEKVKIRTLYPSGTADLRHVKTCQKLSPVGMRPNETVNELSVVEGQRLPLSGWSLRALSPSKFSIRRL